MIQGDSDSLSVEREREIDAVCSEFEDAWKEPRIEDYLGRVPAEGRAKLLRELVALDVDLRRSLANVDPQDYCQRFADRREDVDAAFSILQQRSALARPDASTVRGVESRRDSAGEDSSCRQVSQVTTKPRFRFVRNHAEGGLGVVSVAMDTELNRMVALKEMHDRHVLNRNRRSRFLLEAEITGALEHPGVVPVYSLGSHSDGRPYYAMQLIDGESLQTAAERFHQQRDDRRGQRYQSLAMRKLLTAFVNVCNTVAFAHTRGVLHRDLKPDNIMLGRHGETMVVDWGLAKRFDSTMGPAPPEDSSDLSPTDTHQGAVVGTPGYMSPEQAAGHIDEVSQRSDVYGLGSTLYTLLTGQAPFPATDGGSADRVLSAVMAGEFPQPRTVRPETPAALEAICLKAMAADPAHRYTSPSDLAADVERWLADEPMSAYRQPWLDRARRFVKRHQVAVASAAAALVMTAVGLLAVAIVVGQANGRLRELNQTIETKNRELTAANASLKAARHAADLKRAEAEQQRTRARNVLDFMVAAFQRPDPTVDGRKITLAEALPHALDHVDELKDDPLAVAELSHAIGRSFIGLGLSDEAKEPLRRAAETFETHLGPGKLKTLVAWNHLGQAYIHSDQPREAIAVLKKALKRSEETLGSDDTNSIDMLNSLAGAHCMAHDFDEAIRLWEDALERRRRIAGDDAAETLNAMNNLGGVYVYANRADEAIQMLREVLRLRREKLGRNHPHALGSANNLAAAYNNAKRYREALQLHEEILPEVVAVFGDRHPNTWSLKNNLGYGYRRTGQLDKAVPMIQEALRQRQERLGAVHSDTLDSMNNLAEAYMAAKSFDKAVELLEQHVSPEDPPYVTDHRVHHYLAMLVNLADAHWGSGGRSEPIKLLKRRAALSEQRLGAGHPKTIDALDYLALACDRAGETESAVGYYRRLALMLQQQDHLPAAERDKRLRTAIGHLVRLYTALDKPQEAAESKRKLESSPLSGSEK